MDAQKHVGLRILTTGKLFGEAMQARWTICPFQNLEGLAMEKQWKNNERELERWMVARFVVACVATNKSPNQNTPECWVLNVFCFLRKRGHLITDLRLFFRGSRFESVQLDLILRMPSDGPIIS